MRDLTDEFIAAMTSSQSRPAILVKFGFDSGVTGMWTGKGTYTYEGLDYFGGADVLKISRVEETENLQATGISLSLSGVKTSLITLSLTENYQSRPLQVYLAYFVDQGVLAQEVSDIFLQEARPAGFALESNTQLYTTAIFDGLMNVARFNAENGSMVINMSVENILTQLKRTKQRFYTHEDQTREYAGDLGFEFIAALQDKDLVW